MLAPWPIGDKLTGQTDLCNNAELGQKRSRLIDLCEDGMISKDEFGARSDRIEQDSICIAAKLDVLDEPDPIDYQDAARRLGSLADLMNNLEITQQRELLRTVMGDITVGKHSVEYSVYALPTAFVDCNRTGRGSLPICHVELLGERSPDPDMPGELKTLGDNLRTRRIERGLKQRQVAEIIGVTEWTIRNWELNRLQPRARYVPAIYDFLGYCLFEPGLPWGDECRMRRAALGMTLESFAQAIGVDESTVRNWEAGVIRPIRASREKVATYFAAIR